ncbi:MAG TPA: hypothetical protein EYF95_05955 [Flavobacteriales bacterium]|jgi:hypothetical protein|nr:hypothetical protein [Flavobacteriales bacterium]
MKVRYTSITYVGKTSGFIARVKGATYEFEWQGSLGVGNRKDEVPLEHATNIARWRDKRGKRLFILE